MYDGGLINPQYLKQGYLFSSAIFLIKLLAEGEFVLKKFPGKGGLTFVKVPIEILLERNAFGMIRVYSFDANIEFEGKQHIPMPIGFFFLPIAKTIGIAIGGKIREIL